MCSSDLFFSLNSITFLAVYYTKTHPATRGFASIKEASKGLGAFARDGLTFWISNVFEWSGWEICGYYNALSHDNNQISAFSSMMNIVYIVIDIGFGFLVVGRTRVNYLLGAGYSTAAKKVGLVSLVAVGCTSLITGTIIYLLRNPIANMYASNSEETLGYLVKMLALYRFFLAADMGYTSIATLMRSTNNVVFSTSVCIAFCIVGNFSVCWYMRKYLDIDCIDIFISMYACISIAMILCVLRLIMFDWSKIALQASSGSVLGPPANEIVPRESLASILRR